MTYNLLNHTRFLDFQCIYKSDKGTYLLDIVLCDVSKQRLTMATKPNPMAQIFSWKRMVRSV